MVDFIGAVRDPQFRQGVGQGLVDAAGRGLAMIGGAPVDLTTMFLRPLGYSVPDEQIIGSSEYLGRQMADMGLISQARNPLAEFLSALLIPDPTDIQKLAPYVQRAMSADLIAARPNVPMVRGRTTQAGQVGVKKKPEDRFITTQSYIDDDIVQQKRDAKDYDVLVSPEFDVDGEKMRVILDGHHSFKAAQMDNVTPKIKEADVSDDDRIALMDKSLDDFLMSVHTGDTDYYDFSTGKPIF